MKYSRGDSVKVINDLSRGTRYPYQSYGRNDSMDVNADMQRLAGETVTITQANESGTYHIEECRGTKWVDSMFEDVASTLDFNNLKVGDKVKIKEELDDGVKYYYVDKNSGDTEFFNACYSMTELSGQIVTITKVDGDGTFKIDKGDRDDWWCASMFETPEDKPAVDKDMVLQVGDSIKVIDHLLDQRYHYKDKKTGERQSFSTYGNMRDMSGKFVTISKVDADGTYRIMEDRGDNWWCNSMFDLNSIKKEAEEVSGEFKYESGRLYGSCLKRYSRGDIVRLIPFIKYNDDSIYFRNPKNGDRASRDCYRNLKQLILTDIEFCRDYDDGDAEIRWKNNHGDWESCYAPMCCLMPKDTKVRDLPRPNDSDMGRLYDAYVSKYEPLPVTEAVKEVPEEPAKDLEKQEFKNTDYVMMRDDIFNGKYYNIRGERVKADDVERYKGKIMKFSECQDDGKYIRFYHDSVIHCPYKDFFKVAQGVIERKDYSQDMDWVNFVSQRESYSKADIIHLLGKDDDSRYPRKTKRELLTELYENYKETPEIKDLESKINLNDESEEVKMSKLGGMLNKMFGEVGEVKDASLALTFGGAVAIKRRDGDYVRYDEVGETLENQGSFILPGSEKFMLLMPSPTVAVGDIIKNKGKFLQVLEVKANGNLSTVNFESGTKTNVIKETNLFGLQYYTKVMSMMTGMAGTDGTTPGGMNPLMMLILSKDEEGAESKMDMTTMMMMSGMFGGQGGAQGGMNPMMMMMLMGDKEEGAESGNGMKDMMMMSMFMGGNSPFGNMFGGQQQLTAPQVAEPLKPVATGLEALVTSQAEAITQLNNTVKELTIQLADKNKADKKAATAAAKKDADATK